MRACVAGILALAACTIAEAPESTPRVDRESLPFDPEYRGVQTRLLDVDLVNFLAEMTGARDVQDVDAYAACAAVQYALIRGYGFARHVRTNVDEEGGVWRADAVYTISLTLPPGAKPLNAETKVAECRDEGIPTI